MFEENVPTIIDNITKLIRYLFVVLKTLLKYKLHCMNVNALQTVAKKYAKKYITQLNNVDCLVKDFWDKNQHKIKPFYIARMREDDVIVSATADFLLEEILSRIGTKHYLSTKVDPYTGEVMQICYRGNKADLFRAYFPDVQIENFYTDSKNDAAMIHLANNAYMVKGEHIKQIDKNFV